MKAIIYTQYGPPEVLSLQEIEKPVPKDNEILVKVRATSVNRTDCANLRAKPDIMRLSTGLLRPKNPILGTEFSGDVETVGNTVTAFKAGDKVFGFDDSGLCSYAEYLVMAENKPVAIMPEGFDYQQAAACIEGFHYAFNFYNKVRLQKGDKVLVNGASGGIGSATVQLLVYYGVRVTAVCNTKNLDLITSLGAMKVIDYTKEDFTKDNEKYDCVFDTVGKSSFGKCKAILKPGGVYISSELGQGGQNIFLSLITAILGRVPGQGGRKVKFPYPPDKMRSIRVLKQLIEAGKYRAIIDRTYPLEQIADAFRYVETGQKTGNVGIII